MFRNYPSIVRQFLNIYFPQSPPFCQGNFSRPLQLIDPISRSKRRKPARNSSEFTCQKNKSSNRSKVLHPKNPFAPTLHFNYRYFETDAPKDTPGAPRQWWFGGGTDLTPAYIIEEDVKHFHSIQKQTCDKFDPSFYPRFKKWCDDYFTIKHRGEMRGLGGIFFDDMNDYDQEMLLSFATECAKSVVPAYVPIVEKRKDVPYTEENKVWQQLRRGRYEFNLFYDRCTTFGLKTGGRIESILVSLPLTARWQYDHKPEEGSEEWKLLDACLNPKEWV